MIEGSQAAWHSGPFSHETAQIFFRCVSAMSSVHIKKIVDEPGIVKSAEDKRLYRALELNNGMRVMLISDPQTDKSSAAMDVYIGNFSLRFGQ